MLGVVVCVVGKGATVGAGTAGATVMWSRVDVGAARLERRELVEVVGGQGLGDAGADPREDGGAADDGKGDGAARW